MPEDNDYLGEFEHLVLLAVMRLGDDAYGVSIRRTIAERAERSVSFGAVYSTLRRLNKKGYLTVDARKTASKGAGRPRKTYVVTPAGRLAIASARRRFERMSEGVHVSG